MHDEHNREQQSAPQTPTSDTTRWGRGYFPYDPPAQADEPASRQKEAQAAQTGENLVATVTPTSPLGTPVRPPELPAPSPQAQPQQTGRPTGGTTWYGSSYAAGNGLRTPPGMMQTPPPPRKASDSDAQSTPQAAGQPPAARPALPYHNRQPKRRGSFLRAVCLLLLCLVVGGGSGYFITQRTISDWEASQPAQEVHQPVPQPDTPVPTPAPPQVTPVRTGDRLSAEEIYELGRQQVVGITTEITTTNIFGQATTGRVSGSGFIVSADGYILTNYHVIEGATRILVMLADYSMHEAELIGGEGITSDMAVLKIDATDLDLNVATIGSSADMRVGSPAYAIGNPLGELTFTITSGIVSALNREVAVDQGQTLNMFQIDAAVNSGNSGGPVYNERGEVVGIVTAKSGLAGVEGIGFAIPIDDAMQYANQLIERGYIPRPYLGIFPVTVSESYAHYFRTVVGVFVNTVYPDTAAERGGILVGDIITAMGGREILTVEDLRAVLAGFSPGDTVAVTVFREEEHLELTLTLGDRPADVGS